MLRETIFLKICFFKDNSTLWVTAYIENWMQKAEENSRNINNLHAQKNRKGSALITQRKKEEEEEERRVGGQEKEEEGKGKGNILRGFYYIDIQNMSRFF